MIEETMTWTELNQTGEPNVIFHSRQFRSFKYLMLK